MFDKKTCLANIRMLLRNSEIKIGQIEKAAGCQPGYMSRLEKDGNTAEPSVEFLTVAAHMLKSSIDAIIFSNLCNQTPT